MSPTTSVGVLVPLRIETKFSPPQGTAGWQLRVRVIPDVVSIDTHDPLASDVELTSVEAMWRNCAGDLAGDQGKAEWRALTARHGAGRAAWLARTFPPVTVAGVVTITRPAQIRTDPRVAQIAGLPPVIELWLARGGGAPAKVASLTVDASQLASDLPDPTTGEARWWSSFAKAVQVGLATQIDLGPQGDDIDVLYAVGIGGGDPGPLFRSHRDAGALAVLPLGTATNSVDGEPAADLARDPETWRELVLSGGAGDPATQALSTALCGDAGALAPLPGGKTFHADANHAMVAALWPSVFGFGLKNLWSIDDGAFAAGVWALDNLVPEGPVPPLRIGDQPYGVLPVSALTNWVPGTGDPPVEAQMRPWLLKLLDAWVDAAETAGTTAGADTDKLLKLMGQTPSSTGYSWRWFLPLEVLHPLSWGFGGGVKWHDLVSWWDRNAAPVLAFPLSPTRRYGTLGYVQDLAMPLVEPSNLAPTATLGDAIGQLLKLPPVSLVNTATLEASFPQLPNSLLFRLILFSLVAGSAEVARASVGRAGALLEPPYVADTQTSELATWVAQMDPSHLPSHPSSRLWAAARDGAAKLAGFDTDTLERVMKATIDSASYRLDPWIIGIAWRRLRSLTSAAFDLGAYGWVDSPRPATDGSFSSEYLHAPSEAQALTAAVLRDRSISDPEPGRWHMDLTSDGVRLADQLAAEIRLGAHLSEVLGQAIERVVATPADIARLRSLFPIRTEHAGRRVCDGLQVMAALHDDPPSLALSAVVLSALAPIAEAVDVYGDLLVADAVFDVVSGRAEQASASMEAAAGLAAPPVLDVIRTQRRGRGVSTTVVAALVAAPAPTVIDETTSPGRIADPSVAAYSDDAFGGASSASWTWLVHHPDGVTITPVTLADLALAPIDTASLSGANLSGAALAASGAPAGSTVTPNGEFDAHVRLIRLLGLLGSQPAVGSQLATDGSEPSTATIQTDLITRYSALRAAGEALITGLAAAATDAARRAALTLALKWGVTPIQHDDPSLATLATRAGQALADRLQSAPSEADAAGLGINDLARVIAEAASPGGRLAVLARHQSDALPATLAPGIDPDWLETVAPVRGPLARVEAWQLEQATIGATPLSAWTNRPDDPWQTTLPTGTPPGGTPATKLVAAFGPPGVLDAGPDRQVAIGLVDSWGETIPATEHATSVAFHFDAPASRPPQAILLAVPPDLNTPLDTAGTVAIVVEARRLAHARAAIPEQLDAFAVGLPLTMLPANAPAGVALERA